MLVKGGHECCRFVFGRWLAAGDQSTKLVLIDEVGIACHQHPAADINLLRAKTRRKSYACAIGRRRQALSDATLKAYEHKLDHRLDQIMALIPSAPAGIALHKVFKKIRAHLFVFVTNREVSPTNNGSERAVRPCTIYRKITNGFRAEWAAELYADVRGVVETGRRRSLRAIDAIRLTLAGTAIPLPA